MYEKFKNYIGRYYWITYLIMAGIACLCCWIIYGGGNNSDYNRTIDHMERVKGEQQKSIELNQTVEDAIDRSAQLNQRASERISRAQEYQQRASDRIKEGASRLDEAERLLERNEQLIRDVEQGHQAQQGNRSTVTPPTEHVGAD